MATPADPAAQHDPEILEALVDHPQGVSERGQHHYCRAVLVVVEHRDRQRLVEARLDLEAAGCGDVLQVDPAEHRLEAFDGLDQVVGAVHPETDRHGVDPTELLEEHRLAFHHRQRGVRADVAEAEHRGAVGDDRDGVGLHGVAVDQRRLSCDGPADPGHPGGVGHRQVVPVGQDRLRLDRDLAAAVQGEGAILDLDDLDALHPPSRGLDLGGVDLGGAVDDQVPGDGRPVGGDHLDSHQAPPGCSDRGGQAAEGARTVLDDCPQTNRVCGQGGRHGVTLGPKPLSR
jgi:hypothetical protein